MRPTLRFLTDELIERIIAEAIDILCSLGVTIHNAQALSVLSDHGATVDRDGEHARFSPELIERAIRSAPHSFPLYDVLGVQTHDFRGDAVYFTPGSTALNVLDYPSQKTRKPTTLDFESCLSLEKLVLDNEQCGMALRLVQGIEPREDFPARPLLQELLRDHNLLIADHTRRHWKSEIWFPGPVIDRARRERWKKAGSPNVAARADRQVARLLETYAPSRLPEDRQRELIERIEHEARRLGVDRLPRR